MGGNAHVPGFAGESGIRYVANGLTKRIRINSLTNYRGDVQSRDLNPAD
jgi:hypothetical protein